MMTDGSYEKVQWNPKLPALVAYIDEADITFPFMRFIPPHWHRSLEITLVAKGQLCLKVNTQKTIVNEGEFIFVNSSEVHAVEKIIDEPSAAIVIIISYEFTKKLIPNIDQLVFDVLLLKEHKQEMIDLFMEMKRRNQSDNENDYLRMNACLHEILFLLMENCQCEVNRKTCKSLNMYSDRQKEILTYLEEHYSEELTLETVAQNFRISPSYFSRQFHKCFHVNFKLFLNDLRLNKAFEDIIKTDKSIQNVALENGFYNVKSFIEMFKATYTVTPLQYRKLYTTKNDYKSNKN